MKKKILGVGIIAILIAISCFLTGCTDNKTTDGNQQVTADSSNMLYLHYDNDTKLYGYINSKGEYVIEPQFYEASAFDEESGLAKVKTTKSELNDSGYINKSGEFVIEPEYSYTNSENFKGEYAPICKWSYADSKGYYYLANKNGEIVTTGTNYIEMGYPSKDNMIAVKYCSGSGKDYQYWCGYINLEDEILIKLEGEFYGVTDFGENDIAFTRTVSSGSSYAMIDKEGNVLTKSNYLNPKSGYNKNGYMVVGSWSGGYGIIDLKGEFLVDYKFYDIGYISDNNLAFAKETSDGKYGIINEKGEWVVEPKFDNYSRNGIFNENGIALVIVDEKYGTINEKGEYITEPIYASANMPDGANYFVIQDEDKNTGIIGADGKELIAPF